MRTVQVAAFRRARLGLLCALSFAVPACYGEPRLPDVAEDSATTPPAAAPVPVPPARQGNPPPSDPGAQRLRMQQLALLLDRLGPQGDGVAPEARAGASAWREAELAKMFEIGTACCEAGSAPCRECLSAVAARNLPADELWPLLGSFMGALRVRAEDGIVALGTSLLLRPDGLTRDRAFRVAIGSGGARRGEPDPEARRASSIPLSPREGDPVWIVFEQPAACAELQADLKGPDRAGRFDLLAQPRCPPAPPEDVPVLRANRVVWAFFAGELAGSGFSLWVGGDQPLLTVRPRPEAPPVRP